MTEHDWLTEQFGLAGQTALVTGARTGIGRACAVALASAGADVVLWGRRPEDLDDVADQIRALGRQARCVGVELGDRAALVEAAEDCTAQTQVDILVNNAGTIRRAPAAETSLPDWDAVIRVNLDAVFALTRTVGRRMLARGRGHIVTVASLLSFQGGINVPAYTASKHAVVGLTKALANEWAPRGVNVNAVAPGYVLTNNTKQLRSDDQRRESITARIPAGRWATPEDIAGAVVFLAGPAAAYLHGEVLAVDGGWLAR